MTALKRSQQLQEVQQTHFRQLNHSGFLDRKHFLEICEIIYDIPHLIRIRHLRRYVRLFTHCTCSDLSGDDIRYATATEIINKGYYLIQRHEIELYIPKGFKICPIDFDGICNHIHTVVTNTLIWRSIQKEKLNNLVAQLQEALSNSDELNIDRVARFISSRLHMTVSLIEKRTDRIGYQAPRQRILSLTRAVNRANIGPSVNAKIITSYIIRRLREDRFSDMGLPLTGTMNALLDDSLDGAKLIQISGDTIFPNTSVRGRTYIILPLCRSIEPRSRRNQLFLISKRGPGTILHTEIYLIQELISYYFDHLLRERQQRLIVNTTRRINDLHRLANLKSMDLLTEYENTFTTIMREIIWTTASYKCSFWQYSPEQYVLKLKHLVDLDRGRIRSITQLPESVISVGKFDSSSIVNCFVNAILKPEPLYIDDVRFPMRYLDKTGRQMRAIVPPQERTQSEVVIPIYEAATPVGVLYCASRVLDAFESDIWYLQSVGALLSELRTATHRKLDSSFVAERLAAFDAYHELGTQIQILLRGHPEVLQIVRKFLDLDRIAPAPQAIQLRLHMEAIVEELRQEFSLIQLQDVCEEVFERVKIQTNVPTFSVDENKHRALVFILKNFLANAFRHRPRGFSSTLTVEFEACRGLKQRGGKGASSSAGVMRIENTITPSLRSDLVSQLGQRSIAAAGRFPRRGLHLVGLVTRHIGGTFSAFQTSPRSARRASGERTRIVLRIPMTAGEEGVAR